MRMLTRSQIAELVPIGNAFPVDGDPRRYDPVSAVGAGVQGIGSIVGGLIGRGASKQAATAQANAQQGVIDNTGKAVTQGYYDVNTGADRAQQTLQGTQQQQVAQYQPYQTAGATATSQLTDLTGANSPLNEKFSFNPSDLESDPGYKFTLQQGQQAIQKAAAAQGGLFSSGTLKSLAGYTTGTANQYFNDAFNRASSTFNTNRQGALSKISALQGLAGMGLSGASGASGAIGSTGQQIGANQLGSQEYLANLTQQGNQTIAGALTGQGNAQAAGTIGAANALSGAIGGVGNAAQDFSILNFLSKRQAAAPAGAH